MGLLGKHIMHVLFHVVHRHPCVKEFFIIWPINDELLDQIEELLVKSTHQSLQFNGQCNPITRL